MTSINEGTGITGDVIDMHVSSGIDMGEPLMVNGSFKLRSWPTHTAWNSVITHGCQGHKPNWIAPLDGKQHPCPDCDEVVPQDILAAWILHNFDYIQQRK